LENTIKIVKYLSNFVEMNAKIKSIKLLTTNNETKTTKKVNVPENEAIFKLSKT